MTLQIVILVMVVGNDDDDDDKLHVALFSILHKIDIRLYFFFAHILTTQIYSLNFFFGSEKKIRIWIYVNTIYLP